MFENYFPAEDSRIRFNDISEGSQLQGALKLEDQICPCYVSHDLQPQLKPSRSDRKLKEIPITPHEYALAEDNQSFLTIKHPSKLAPTISTTKHQLSHYFV
jgi:hypothetical protein